MYVRCGSILDAYCAFTMIGIKPTEAWNAIIGGFTNCGNFEEGLKLFDQMQKDGVKPTRVTFLCVLKACSSASNLLKGRRIHAFLIECGHEFGLFVGNALIHMYAKCGTIQDAHNVFCRSLTCDVVTYNTLIEGYAQNGCFQESLCLFKQMQGLGIELDQASFVCVLKACQSFEALPYGIQIHADVIKNGLELDELVGHSLMHMYTSCGDMEGACILFEKLPIPNVISWSTLISGYAENGQGEVALKIFDEMRHQAVKPNQVTFMSVLKACSSCLRALQKGRMIHTDTVVCGFELDTCVGNALIDIYVKCASMDDAMVIFHRMPFKNVVTCNVIFKRAWMVGMLSNPIIVHHANLCFQCII